MRNWCKHTPIGAMSVGRYSIQGVFTGRMSHAEKLVLTVSFSVLLVLFSCGWVQAAIYKDTFTASIGSEMAINGGYNPWGLSERQRFDWWVTFDAGSIALGSGCIEFGGANPANKMTLPIMGSAGGYVFRETDDIGYGDGSGVPYGSMDPVPFVETESTFQEPVYMATIELDQGGWATLFLLYDVDEGQEYYDISFEKPWVRSEFTIDLGLDRFYPPVDRTSLPVPGAVLLFGSGLFSLAALRRRMRKRRNQMGKKTLLLCFLVIMLVISPCYVGATPAVIEETGWIVGSGGQDYPFTAGEGHSLYQAILADLSNTPTFGFESLSVSIETSAGGVVVGSIDAPGTFFFSVVPEEAYVASVTGTGSGDMSAGLYGIDVTNTPLPGALVLLGSGLMGIIALKRRRPRN